MSFSTPTLQCNIPQPHSTIGCQKLLATDEVCHSGNLMKPLRYQKKASFIGPLLDKLPWKNRYVVLSKGSVYLYPDSISKKPSSAYSLYGYHQVVRAGDVAVKKYPWTFKIVNAANPNSCKYFAAGSEREMKIWMREIRSQLIVANTGILKMAKINAPLIVDDDSELEQSIYGKDIESIIKSEWSNSLKSTSSEDDDTDSSYDHIDDTEVDRPLPPLPAECSRSSSECDTSISANGRPPQPLPATTPSSQKPSMPLPPPVKPKPMPKKPKASPPESSPAVNRARPPTPPPRSARSSTEENEPFKMSEVFWDGTDKLAADQIIKKIGKEGVFLVRASDTPGCIKTLVCFADGRPGKFMIKQSSDGKFYLRQEEMFPSIKALLHFYHQNNLPKKMTCLTEPHSRFTTD